MPNNKFLVGFQAKTKRPLRFVKASAVTHSSNAILLTEMINDSAVVTDAGRLNPAVNTCKSNRPLHGFVTLINGNTPLMNPNIENSNPRTDTYRPARPADLLPTQPNVSNISQSIPRLDWVGRNHGSGDWLHRTTNFLCADGHVDSKRLEETVYPTFQWGDAFFALKK